MGGAVGVMSYFAQTHEWVLRSWRCSHRWPSRGSDRQENVAPLSSSPLNCAIEEVIQKPVERVWIAALGLVARSGENDQLAIG